MQDLLVGVIIIGLLSAIAFITSQRVSRRLDQRMIHLLGILTVTILVGYVVHVQGRPVLSQILPFSNLIVVGNWQPLLVSLLAGLIWYRLPRGTWRRSTITVALVGSCLVSIYRPILAQPPKLHDRWDENVCLQTSQASCTPAAAATLLAAYGIRTTEQEMAMLCLTTKDGTSMQGLYRGLKLKTAGTGWEPFMFENGRLPDLRGMGPVLISVELRDARRDEHMQAWGWIPGVPHSIVLLGFLEDDKVSIADPSIGREIWSVDDLKRLWHGEGVRLVRAQ